MVALDWYRKMVCLLSISSLCNNLVVRWERADIQLHVGRYFQTLLKCSHVSGVELRVECLPSMLQDSEFQPQHHNENNYPQVHPVNIALIQPPQQLALSLLALAAPQSHHT